MSIRGKLIFIMTLLSVLPIAVVIGLAYTAPRAQLLDALVPLGIIVAFLVFFFGVNIARSLTRPLAALAEQARRISNGDLSKPVMLDRDDEIGELSRAFNQMVTKLVAHEKSKNAFLDVASHQLQMPQTLIEGSTEGLLTNPQNLTIKQIESLESIHLGTLQMVDALQTVLSMSQFQLGQQTAKAVDVDLAKTIKGVLAEFRRPIKRAGLDLVENYEKGLKLSTDPNLLKVILRNVIANAVLYTEEGRVNVAARDVDGSIEVVVSDTGIGIPSSERKNIYDKFFRGSNAKKLQPNGNGLGLHLAKMCLEEIGGSISFESEHNEGSIFTIKLPEK